MMAYCPSCGREQRCGCTECHACGAILVGGRPTSSRVALEAAVREDHSASLKGARLDRTEPEARPRRPHRINLTGEYAISEVGARLIPPVLLAIGIAIILVGVVELFHTASGLSAHASPAAGSIKRLGYYIAGLLYVSSVRSLVGFAFVAVALLVSPPRPFTRERAWRSVASGAGLVMVLLGFCYVVSVILMALPGQGPPDMVRSLMPGLPGAIAVLVVAGVAEMMTGRLLAIVAPAALEDEDEALQRPLEAASSRETRGTWKRLTRRTRGRKP